MRFRLWLSENQTLQVSNSSIANTTWHYGRGTGLPDLGVHGTRWGVIDKTVANYYAGDKGQVKSFKLRPEAKIMFFQSKTDLMAHLFKWTEEQTDDFILGTEIEDYNELALKMLGQKPTGSAFIDVNKLDTFIAQKMKTSGADAAVMWNNNHAESPEICVVNLQAIMPVF